MSEKLKTGDVIYVSQFGELSGRTKIVRTTEKQAVTKNGTKFKIEYQDSGDLSEIGRTPFSRVYYRIETPELKAAFEKLLLIQKIVNVSTADTLKKLSIETLNQIHSLLTRTT